MKNKNKFKEPPGTYSGSKKISFSDSFEKAEDEQMRYWMDKTPEERFDGFYELMCRFYEFKNPDWSKVKITIDS